MNDILTNYDKFHLFKSVSEIVQILKKIEKVILYKTKKKLPTPYFVVGKIFSWDRDINILVESSILSTINFTCNFTENVSYTEWK